MDNFAEPILPNSWYGKHIVVQLIPDPDGIYNKVYSRLRDTNAVGLLLSDDDKEWTWSAGSQHGWHQVDPAFVPWHRVNEVQLDE